MRYIYPLGKRSAAVDARSVGYSPSSSPPKNMPPSSTPIRMDSIVPKGRRGGTSGT